MTYDAESDSAGNLDIDNLTPGTAEPRTGPLKGLRVIDLGLLIAGPATAAYLADLGADVIKVEHPKHGDPSRSWGVHHQGQSITWKIVGRNKRCITLDLSQPQGQNLLLQLVAEADVLIENFRAGTLERWNLGWETIQQANPNLVMVRTSGFGQSGPYSTYPGFGTLAEAMSGYANMTGEPESPPQLPQFALADNVASLTAVIAALAGVYHRKVNGGGGQWVDNTLYEPLMRLLEGTISEYALTGTVRKRTGNRMPDVAPRGAYETSEPDKWVALSGSNPATARRIFEAIGREDLAQDERLASNEGRRQHADEIDEAIQSWIGSHTVAEVLKTFRAADAPIAPIYDSAGIMEDPHFRFRNTHMEIPDKDFGTMTVQAPSLRFSETPAQIVHTGANLGEHNDEIYRKLLNLDSETILDLQRKGVI